jgi:hypothetical protein
MYVFDISKEPFKRIFFIPYDHKSPLNSRFWLDSDSDKILTQEGIFKIQDVFVDLPKNNSLEKNVENFSVKYGFLKGLRLRIYWFVRSWYWAIKKRAYAIAYALL